MIHPPSRGLPRRSMMGRRGFALLGIRLVVLGQVVVDWKQATCFNIERVESWPRSQETLDL